MLATTILVTILLVIIRQVTIVILHRCRDELEQYEAVRTIRAETWRLNEETRMLNELTLNLEEQARKAREDIRWSKEETRKIEE
jgi:hypothetical protein